MRRELVLAPGLWMPGAAMALLAARLGGRGYRVRTFSYSGRRPYEGNVEALARFAHGAAYFVGHSLGGVLVLDTLNRHAALEPQAVVLLGSPVRGCLAGRRFGHAALGRWMLGECRPIWEARAARWSRGAPLGVIAGTRPFGLGRAFGALPGPNDGVVCVEETAVDGMREQALVSQAHSMLVVSGQVSDLTDRFLGAGRFA
jgi:pimeloyl-ACP methyl ester carboxylesterase